MKRYLILAFLLIAFGSACFDDGSTDDSALKERARGIVTKIFAGDYASVRQSFDRTMEAKLSEAELAEATWAYESTFGSFVSMGEPEIVNRADLRVVNVPLEMSKDDGQARITFDAQDRIAGLYLLRTGVPVP